MHHEFFPDAEAPSVTKGPVKSLGALVDGKDPKLKATVVTAPQLQAEGCVTTISQCEIHDTKRHQPKGVFEFWVGSGCQPLENEGCVSFSLTGLAMC